MEEVWLDIDGYENYYQISNFGRIKSVERKISRIDGRTQKKKSRLLKVQLNNVGYPQVVISKNAHTKSYRVHRLVANAFIPNPHHLPEVNHIDGNKKNNFPNNLEWCTKSENSIHRVEVLGQMQIYSGKPRGITFVKANGLYQSKIKYRKKWYRLGFFQSKSEAYRAYYEKFMELRDFEPWDIKKYQTH